MARVTITEAAQRLNLSPDSIRRRIRKGELLAQRDNKGQWWCDVPDEPPPADAQGSIAPASIAPPNAPMQPHSDALADLRGQVADLVARLDRAEVERAELLARSAAERDRLLVLIEGLTGRPMDAPDPAPTAAANHAGDATRRALFLWLRKVRRAWRSVRADSVT